jgi:hypothetical protein
MFDTRISPILRSRNALRHVTPSNAGYAVLVLGLTFLAARVWWLSTIVPGQDYPQFLVFVRVARDYADPSSPFHGTYTLAPWFVPTSLPIQLTRVLSLPFAGSIESGAKLLLTLQNASLVAASAYLLHVLGRPRWAIVLLFPFVHSRWTVMGGFLPYATAFPLIVLCWALTVRWFRRPDLTSGALLALCLWVTLLWHGLAFGAAGLGFAGLWLLWRAPSLRARSVSVVPTVPSLVQMGVWLGSTFGKNAASPRWNWRTPWEACDRLPDHVLPTVPHRPAIALLLAIILLGGLVVSRRNEGATGPAARMWRVENPFLVVASLYLAAYFAFPENGLGVEILSPRFSIQAAMAAVFAWNLPAPRVARACVLAAVTAFGWWRLSDVAARFREFDADTRGASYLMDEVGLHETLYNWPDKGGGSDAFDIPNKALVELEQFSTVRHGGLPNKSFAGYGMNFVRYVHDNPMPSLHGPPSQGPGMTSFDYVLTRVGQGPGDPGFRLLDEKWGWQLYAVCGSKRFPVCGSGAKP